MAHFKNLQELEKLSDKEFLIELKDAIKSAKSTKKPYKIIVMKCPIILFETTDGKLEAYLDPHIDVKSLRTNDDLSIALEFAKRIWGINMLDLEDTQDYNV